LECAGGAQQIPAATQPLHAVQFWQLTGVGGAVNAKMQVTSASATATLTADQVIVCTALNGLQYLLPSFSQSINLGTTGIGGMDTGSAPVSGYVAVYAAYNPTTKTAGMFAQNTTSVVAPNIYGGANVPAGYAATWLVGVYPTNGSGQFVPLLQNGRRIARAPVAVLSSSSLTSPTTPSNLNVAGAVPKNAVTAQGILEVQSTVASTMQIVLVSDPSGTNNIGYQLAAGANTTTIAAIFNIILEGSAQLLYYINANSVGTPTFTISVSGYEF
jgi:hypothetical protein